MTFVPAQLSTPANLQTLSPAFVPPAAPGLNKNIAARSAQGVLPRSHVSSSFQPLSMRSNGANASQSPTKLNGIFGGGPSEPPELNGLTPAAIDALIDASASLFSVDVLEKDGKTLVLLGESHVKPAIAARAGEAVLKHFPVRVLEGATMPGDKEPDTTNASIGDTQNKDAAASKKQRGGIWGAYFNFLSNVEEVTGGLLEGSTITVAASQTGKDDQGREIINKRMEAGHVPSAREAATFKMLPVYLAASTALEMAHKISHALPENAANAVELARAIINLQSTMTYIDTISGGRLSDNAVGHIVNPMSGILHGRSETMAKNIGKTVDESNDKKTPTLAIMGAAHVHKVMEDLSKNQGFNRVYLPGQHSGDSILDDMARKAQSDIRLIEKIAKNVNFKMDDVNKSE